MEFIKSVGTALGVIASLFGVCTLIYVTFLKKFWLSRQAEKKEERRLQQEEIWAKHQDELMKVLEAQNIIIKEIKAKLYPNGGSSVDDKLEVAQKMLKGLETILIDVSAGQRNTWEIMDIAVWKSNGEGKTVYVNRPYCELVGCSYTDAIGMSWLGLIAKEHRSDVKEAWEESVKTISDFDMVYCYRRSDGKYQKVNAIAIHNRDKKSGKLHSSTGRLIAIGDPSDTIN